MWKNFLKTSLRNIFRNKTTAAIQIGGLAAGLAASILIMFYVHFERSYENMHDKADHIYRLALELYNGNELLEVDTETYQTLGPEFKAIMPEVLDYVRFYHIGTSEITAVSTDTKGHESRIYFADPSAFDIFSYQLLDKGNLDKFGQPFTAVISKKTALKFFGKIEVVGEILKLDIHENPMEIVAVVEDLPQNTHLKFEMLISHATLSVAEPWYSENLWNANNEYTYLLMNEDVDLKSFNQKLRKYCEDSPHITNDIVIAERISDIHLYSNKRYEPEVNGSAKTVNFILYIGLLILFLAWINYINLSTAKALERAKEVGIRKTIGSSKVQLVFQFFCEAFLTNLVSAIIAVIVVVLALPAFGNFTGQELSLHQFGKLQMGVFLLGVIAFGTLISGFYPAMILSRFMPALILKGRFSNSGKGIMLRKTLVFAQFTASAILICMSVAVYRQMQHLTNMDLGISLDNTLVLRKPAYHHQDSLAMAWGNTFETELSRQGYVKGVTQAETVPGADINDLNTNSGIRREGADKSEGRYNYYHYNVKKNYPDLMEIEVVAGKNFDPQSAPQMVLVSEKAAELLGFATSEEAIGQKLNWHIYQKPAEIVGVFRNFHQRSPKEQYLPLILWQHDSPSNFIVKLNTTDTQQALAGIEALWYEIYPDHPLDYFFLNDMYNYQYYNDLQFGKTILLFTFLAIIIAVLGLFGLSSYMVLSRTKEIGVRKVLGASVSSLISLLTKDFLSIVFLAGIAAIPIAYMLVQMWLENYATSFEQDWLLFAIPIIVVLGIAGLTVGGQTFRSAHSNPLESLRSE